MGEFYDIGHEPGDRSSVGAGWLGSAGRRRCLDAEPAKLGKVSIGSSLCIAPSQCKGSLTLPLENQNHKFKFKVWLL